jgi:hypothetical protein
MDQGDILTRLEVVIDKIEYDEIGIGEVYDMLTSLVSDIEFHTDYDADFGDVQFDDLD